MTCAPAAAIRRRAQETMTIEETTPAVRGRRPARRTLLLAGLGALLVFGLVLAAAALAGLQVGQSDRSTSATATYAADLQNQYDRGVDDLAAGRFELAVARFEYVLERDPNYRDAAAKLAEAQAGQQSAPATPTFPVPTTDPAATPPPIIPSGASAAELFAAAQAAYAEADWDGVIAALSELHAVDPAYEAVKVDGMLYVAFRSRGVARIVAGDALESGIFDLDQAEAFGPLDNEALNYRAWARTYLAALGYWEVDWGRAMSILQELSLVAPYFHDTPRLLYESTVNYADQLAAGGDACTAAIHYAEAQALQADDAVAEKLAAAQSACGQATAEPGATADPSTTVEPAPSGSPSLSHLPVLVRSSLRPLHSVTPRPSSIPHHLSPTNLPLT
jgi:tetratricopeptide (TPR) repeat protein